jgi:hypothetical protein
MVNDVSMIRFLNIWDLVLTPIFLVLLINLAKRFRNRHYPEGHPLRRYYLPGLYVKFFGAIFIALVYEYYYGGGDTYNFFWHCRVINGSLSDSPSIWFKLIFHTPVVDDPKLYPYVSQMFFYEDKSSHATYAIAAVVGLLTGTNYIPTALIFAFLAYTGIWAMFRSFVGLRPHLHKQLAIAFLFIPSTFVWGSAIFKDTVCMFSLGWITYCTFGIFIRRDFSPRNILLLATSIFLIGLIKIYILMAFMPAIGLWLLMIYSKKIENVLVRWVVNLGFIALLGSVSLFFADRFSKELNEYSLENIAKKSKEDDRLHQLYLGKYGGLHLQPGPVRPHDHGHAFEVPAGGERNAFPPLYLGGQQADHLPLGARIGEPACAQYHRLFQAGIVCRFPRHFHRPDPRLSIYLHPDLCIRGWHLHG